MKRQREHAIGTLIREYLRSEGLETPLNEYQLLSSWGKIAGKIVERNTGKLFIKNEVLYAEIKSPSLRMDLMLTRTDLMNRLNAEVGFHVIRDIVLF